MARLVDNDLTRQCFQQVERRTTPPTETELERARDVAPGWVSEDAYAGTAQELGAALAPLGGRVVSTETSGNVWVIQDESSGPVAVRWVGTDLPGYGAYWQREDSIRAVAC